MLDVGGSASLEREIAWLANVLRSRDFPLEHLARNLELAADVVDEQLARRAPRWRPAARSGGVGQGAVNGPQAFPKADEASCKS